MNTPEEAGSGILSHTLCVVVSASMKIAMPRDEQENGDNPSGELHANSASWVRSRRQPPVERSLIVERLCGHRLQTSLSPRLN
jgi:hypothetical protein